MNPRYTLVSGTVRQFLGPNNFADIPTIVRIDTKTGQAWFLESVPPTGMEWVNITERGDKPAHD